MTDTKLYDESAEPDELYQLELNDGLTDEELEDAFKLRNIACGVMIVTGMPGAGKDLFGHVLSWKLKKYFKGKRVLKDERPRRLYGEYTLFDEAVLMQDLLRMSAVAKGDIPKEISRSNGVKTAQVADIANKWLTSQGEVLLKGSVLYLTEFWRYMHNRRPHNPMGIAVGGIIKQWRHLDLLVIGTSQQKHELDAYSCIPFVTYEVRCEWCDPASRPNTGHYMLDKVRYMGRDYGLQKFGKTKHIFIDGGAPREQLRGKRWFDLYNSKSAPQMKPTMKIEM